MKREISRETYDELKGMPGIELGTETKYFITTAANSTPKAKANGVRRKGRYRRTPRTVFRLSDGYDRVGLTRKQNLARLATIKYLAGRHNCEASSRDLVGSVSKQLNMDEHSASYYVGILWDKGVLVEVITP